MAFDKTVGTILGAAILAVMGLALLPSAEVFFLLMFLLVFGAAVWSRIRGRWPKRLRRNRILVARPPTLSNKFALRVLSS